MDTITNNKKNIVGQMSFLITKHTFDSYERLWLIRKDLSDRKIELSNQAFKNLYGIDLVQWLEHELLEDTEYNVIAPFVITSLT